MKVSPDGAVRNDARYLLVGRDGAARPDPVAGGVALCADGALGAGAAVGAMLRGREVGVPARSLRRGDPGSVAPRFTGEPADGIGAFAGPPFDPHDIHGHLSAWPIGTQPAG